MEDTSGTPNLSDDQLALLESIFELARQGRTDELMKHVEAGVPVDLTNSRGDTLLILAAYHRKAETVSALLGASADTGRVNDMGQTALTAATFRNDARIVTDLLAAGADAQLGQKSAIAVAQQFELSEMEALLRQ